MPDTVHQNQTNSPKSEWHVPEYGKPVILVGENGCGKTSIINDRIRTVCSGEVAEVLSLSIPANRYLYDICLLSCFI
jgi:putative ribosome biogenesis GTPase RsgA